MHILATNLSQITILKTSIFRLRAIIFLNRHKLVQVPESNHNKIVKVTTYFFSLSSPWQTIEQRRY